MRTPMNRKTNHHLRVPPRRIILSGGAAILAVLVAGSFVVGSRGGQPTASEPFTVQAAELGGHPQNLGELADRSEAVVRGVVIAVEPGRILVFPEEEPNEQLVDVTLDIREVLRGEVAVRSIAIEMFGWELDGLTPPAVGDEMVWFVVKDNQLSAEDGPDDSVARYGLASYDGFFHLRGGKLSSTVDGADRLGQQSTGLTLDDLVEAIAP